MAQIDWSDQSEDDLQDIAKRISKDLSYYADVTIEKIYNAVERLRVFPFSGRIVPELGIETVREIIVGNYRVVYWILGERCEIVSVLHSKQDLPKKLLSE
ncbi:MAG: type II toxin-antitoxin system RelE/ParE family toxin [Ignavibacteriae bacterium]|nr:type II toxin-antitoxin system RelE/ParE family toxin [Ignavibacteriota bacterium]